MIKKLLWKFYSYYGTAGSGTPAPSGNVRVTDSGDTRIIPSGDVRVTA